MGISSREDYEKAKEKQREGLEQSGAASPEQMPAEDIAFWKAPAPAPLQPIVIQLQPYEYARRPEPPPAQSSFGPQGIAGVLFTLWLIYNMS